jgi:hypothetical protein
VVVHRIHQGKGGSWNKTVVEVTKNKHQRKQKKREKKTEEEKK